MEKNRFYRRILFKVHIKRVAIISPGGRCHCITTRVVSKLLQSSERAYDGHYHYLGLIIHPTQQSIPRTRGRVDCCYVSRSILTYHRVIICQSVILDYLIIKLP